jgi:hypothetical protein
MEGRISLEIKINGVIFYINVWYISSQRDKGYQFLRIRNRMLFLISDYPQIQALSHISLFPKDVL